MISSRASSGLLTLTGVSRACLHRGRALPRLGLLCCRPGLLPKPTSSQDLDTRSPSQLSQDPAEGWPRGRSDNASKITPVEGHVPSTLPACLPETGPAHREASVDWMVCVEVVLPASGPPWARVLGRLSGNTACVKQACRSVFGAVEGSPGLCVPSPSIAFV